MRRRITRLVGVGREVGEEEKKEGVMGRRRMVSSRVSCFFLFFCSLVLIVEN